LLFAPSTLALRGLAISAVSQSLGLCAHGLAGLLGRNLLRGSLRDEVVDLRQPRYCGLAFRLKYRDYCFHLSTLFLI
jgi:hypothetical protein